MAQSVIMVNRRGAITFADRESEHFLKIPAVKVLGYSLAEVMPETRVLEVFISGQALRCQHILGEQAVQAYYLPLRKQDGLTGVIIYLHDTDGEQEQEAAARAKKEEEATRVLIGLYEEILADLPLGMAVVNREGRIVMLNSLYRRYLGMDDKHSAASASKLDGQLLAQVAPFTRLPQVMETGEGFLDTGVRHRGQTFLLTETAIVSKGSVLGGLSKLLVKEGVEGQEFQNFMERVRLLEGRLMFYKEELQELRRLQVPLQEMVGEGASMQKLKQQAARVARGDANILITGESGTGKGLLAQGIHTLSPRSGEPFIKINCAAIPENLLESELFGYEDGAFTGAVKGGKPGKFELANGGTILLDEIGDMPLAMQAKILRILQEKAFERVGGTKTITVDVRVIAATNRDLRRMIEEQKFRLDLYYRLAVINLHIPALKDRCEDILLLAAEISKRLGLKYAHTAPRLDPLVEEIFVNYSWPGNVRELENVLEHAFNFVEPGEEVIRPEHLPAALADGRLQGGVTGETSARPELLELDEAVARAETDAIRRALRLAKGNKQEAARILGIHPSGLYQKLKKYEITD